ncbi:hypothetical protein GGF32_010129 [Allomyces javanicus]|nr:hypothetical protein GGF32_010129 [Allomyces javanicus]
MASPTSTSSPASPPPPSSAIHGATALNPNLVEVELEPVAVPVPTQEEATGGRLGYGAMNFIAGTFGGFAGVLAGQPFDTVKVRLQVQSDAGTPRYKGTVDCFVKIVREEKVFGLFKGMSSPLVGVAMVNALLFGVYGSLLEKQLDRPDATPTLSQIFLAGSGSGFVNAIISCPMELAKIRMQNQTDATHSVLKTSMPHFNSPLHCLRYLYATRGIRGTFIGFGATVVRETPSYGTYFFMYEALCRGLAARRKPVEGVDPVKDAATMLSPIELMLAGGLSGIAGWMSTYPADVIKTKIQSADPGTFRGMLHCAQHTIKVEGITGLWRGAMATIVRAFPTNAATFVVWHHAMELLRTV